ncbi:hypothetical protein GQ44DRAFT_632317, partial [Phaeosphaeriaceae sp. PMI808]
IDQVTYTIDIIIKVFNNEMDRTKVLNKGRYLAALIASWYLFDKYYAITSNSSVYAASLLLCPLFWLQYIKDN